MENNEKELKCDDTCCTRSIVLLYEGEEFRKYLEHHVTNYKLHRKEVSITLRGVVQSLSPPSYDGFNPPVFEYDNITQGETLVQHINEGLAGSWDGAVFPAHMTGALELSNLLWDWNGYLSKQRNNQHVSNIEMEWMDIIPFFRSQAQEQVDRTTRPRPSSFFEWKSLTEKDTDTGGVVTARTLYAPLDGDVVSLYYRKDLFEQHQIQVPRTWEEYRDAAIYFYGKPWGPNNSTLAGSCVARKASTSTANDMDSYLASLVLSTMTQTKGTSTGFLLDPETAEPILGEAMVDTLLFMAQESALSEGDNENSNGLNDLPTVAWRLNEGSCAMTLSWANLLTMSFDSEQLTNIGVAPTPGSKRVLDRTSGELETCTPELCPYGTYYDDIGIVNRPSYSAFGGWMGGVSNDSTSSRQLDMADFFTYLSNPAESMNDVLPNKRSNFASPYRYSQTVASNWVGAGFDEATALQYIETITKVNSENTVSEIRIPPGGAIRGIINQEVMNYNLGSGDNKFESFQASNSFQQDFRLGITSNMERRIRDAITSADTKTVLESYQSSLSFHNGPEDVSMNYIEIPYRDTGWGVAILICFGSIAVVFWVLWNRKKAVMRAFQPILLIQTAVGFFFMGATLVPLGFDDSLFSKEILDITCMTTPWIYVFGYTLFFSSVYSKIQMCTKIYKNPGKYDRMMVRPRASFLLFCKLFVLNGVLLALWTVVDPLKWSRTETTTYGSPLPLGTVESYGSCKSERFRYPGFAIALFVFNLLCCFVAMLQALRSRLLVLEYRQMQWLQLCIVPFFEAWIIGGPVIVLLHQQPTAQYVSFVLIIASSTIASASAIFGSKEWYVRKHNLLANESKPETPPTPFIRILKHPKFESQKHISNLQNRLERYTTSNTELAIDIRVLQEKFRLLTEKEKLAAVRSSIYSRGIRESEHSRIRSMMSEEEDLSHPDTRDSDVYKVALHDMKQKSNQIDTVITKNSSSNPRVSELSIDMDDLTQLRSEAGKAYSQDDSGPSGGKSGRSILFIESISGSSFALNSRISEESSEDIARSNRVQQISNPKLQGNDSNESGNTTINNSAGSAAQEALHPLSHDELKLDIEGPDISSFSSNNLDEEMEDLNQMIESDNIRDLQSETMLMAEDFKLNSSFLEDVSDLQSNISERDEQDLHHMVHSDNVGDLQSETMLMAEKFKSNNGLLESISDLQADNNEIYEDNLKHDCFHTLDVSNATATSTSSATIVTENYSKVVAVQSDAVNSDLSRSNGLEPISSTGESSGAHIIASEIDSGGREEGNTKDQHAGEPSGDSQSPMKSNGDVLASSNTKNNSVSINGWTPALSMMGLLADVSDSTSNSSRAESVTDSVASLEIISSPRNSGVQMGKDIETLLNHHGFDTGKVTASTHSEGYTGGKNESSPTKLSTTRQKKRELEAKRLSIRRHQQKASPRSSFS